MCYALLVRVSLDDVEAILLGIAKCLLVGCYCLDVALVEVELRLRKVMEGVVLLLEVLVLVREEA